MANIKASKHRPKTTPTAIPAFAPVERPPEAGEIVGEPDSGDEVPVCVFVLVEEALVLDGELTVPVDEPDTIAVDEPELGLAFEVGKDAADEPTDELNDDVDDEVGDEIEDGVEELSDEVVELAKDDDDCEDVDFGDDVVDDEGSTGSSSSVTSSSLL
jgi:hypothetical protein